MEQMIHSANSIKRLVLYLHFVILPNILYVCCGCVHIWSGRVAAGIQQGFLLLCPGCSIARVHILAKLKEPYPSNQKVVGPKDGPYVDLGLLRTIWSLWPPTFHISTRCPNCRKVFWPIRHHMTSWYMTSCSLKGKASHCRPISTFILTKKKIVLRSHKASIPKPRVRLMHHEQVGQSIKVQRSVWTHACLGGSILL